MKIKSKIFLIFFITGVLLTAIGVVVQYKFSSSNIQKEIFGKLVTAAENKAHNINDYFEDKKKDILFLATSPSVRNSLDEQLVQDILDAKNSIRAKAESVTEEVNEYLITHPNMTVEDLQNDQYFQSIAVQQVGITGYTALTDYNKLEAKFHVNSKIVNLDLHTLAEKLPGFWSIMSRTEGGVAAGGFYNWQESDGSLKKKYMYIDIIDTKTADDIGLSVAATTYVEEYSPTMDLVKEAQEYFRELKVIYGYEDLLLISADGDVWWTVNEGQELGVNLEDPTFKNSKLTESFIYVRDNKSAYISDYELYGEKEEPVAYVAAPVYFGLSNAFVGVVVVKIGSDKLNEVMKEGTALGESSDAYLVGEDGFLRSDSSKFSDSTNLKFKVDSENVSNCFMTKNESGSHLDHGAVIESNNYIGEEVIGAHAYILDRNWCLIVETNIDEAFAPIRNTLWVGGLIGIGIIIVIYIVAHLFSRSFSKPILKLRKGVEIVQKGDLNHKINIKNKDEVGELASAFNKMTIAIKNSRQEVDKKVEEQTGEILQHRDDLENQQRAALNVLEDVAEEKERNAQERDKINTILHSIGDGVFVVDDELKIQMFNKMAVEISGFSEEEAMGKKYSDILKFVSEKNKELTDQFIVKALETGEPQFMEVDSVLIRKDKTEVPVADSAAPLIDDDENVVGCIVVFRDVTKDREVEKMKTEFVSIASHQLRTPLTALRWNLEMFEKGLLGKMNAKQSKAMKQIVKTHRYMLFLVNDILDVARIESGRFGLSPEKTQLEEIIIKAAENVQLRAAKKKIKLKIPKFTKKFPHVLVDPTKIFEVIQNLIENAVKYTNPGKKIEVDYKLSSDKKSVVVSVKDQGIGIPKSEQRNMFTKFFRAKNAIDTRKTGTGLGLYIAKNIVEMSNGEIWFDSKENKGTTFYIKLPIFNKNKNG